MTEPRTGASPRQLARVAGGLYLLNIVAGFFAIGVVPGALVVSGDAAATVHNIQTNQLLYRAGLAAHMVPIVCNVALVVILYDLFKVVDRRIALMMVFYSLVGTAVESANLLNQCTPLVLLEGAQQSNALGADQVQDLVVHGDSVPHLPADLYTRPNPILDQHDFDGYVEGPCRQF